jgi:hypothetical protein
MQIGVVPPQCESAPHSAQILVVGLQWGAMPPPSAEHWASVVQLAWQLFPMHT